LHPSFSSLQLCDIGANLLDDMFSGRYHGGGRKHPPDLTHVLERASARAVKSIIVTAGCAKEARQVLQLIHSLEAQAVSEKRAFPELFSTVGVHPTRSSQWNGDDAHQKKYFNQLVDAIMQGLGGDPAAAAAVGGAAAAASSAASSAPSSAAVAAPSSANSVHRRVVVAVGECGLDYDRLHFSDKASQLAHFAKHFELVERVADMTAHWAGGPVHLPLFLHDRNTVGDFLSIVRTHRHRFRHGVVHSFTGSISEVKELLALDLHIGINGCSLKTEENLAVLAHIPLNRLLLETDAPWCDIRPSHASFPLVRSALAVAKTPDKWSADLGVKGRCEPGSMVSVLEVVSAHLGLDPLELAEAVWRNTHEVFFAWRPTNTKGGEGTAA
jgi:TatD DNase family protein